MDPSDIAFVKAVISFVLVAGTGVVGLWLWLRLRPRSAEVHRMVEALRDENAQVQAELGARIAELEERVDFAERHFAQERRTAPLPPPLRTPV